MTRDSFEERQLSQPDEGRASASMSKRQIAYLSPQLGVLNNIPFAIPFETRFRILRAFIELDRREHHEAGPSRGAYGGMFRNSQRATVRRGHIAEDGFNRLEGADLKGPIAITFVDQWGQEEYVVSLFLYYGRNG